MQKFNPRYTYDIHEDMINYWIADVPIEQGLIVMPDGNGKLTVADDYGFFIMREVTTDGPSYMERVEGLYQWDVKVGSAVSVLRPKHMSIIRTVHVVGAGETDVVKGDFVKIVDGKFTVDATLTDATAKGQVIGITADGYYDVLLFVRSAATVEVEGADT